MAELVEGLLPALLTVRVRKASGELLELPMGSGDTVKDLKAKLAELRKSTRNRHRVIFEDKELESTFSLADCGEAELLWIESPDILKVEGIPDDTGASWLNGDYERVDDAELRGCAIWKSQHERQPYLYKHASDDVLNLGPSASGDLPSPSDPPNFRQGFASGTPPPETDQAWEGAVYLWLKACESFPDQPHGGAHVVAGSVRRSS